jgi:MFS superfamily sulfate permease-like transporter
VTALLVVLTLLEIVIVVGVLVAYLVAISRSLRRTTVLLGKVSFGVRAIETQCAPIGPSVLTINSQLVGIAAALGTVTGLAEQAAAGTSAGR